ncbi:hypothetical protein OC842_007228 [Tilletia horrida]|uniref:NADH dehydrogenase [ubiquinone] 1 alpha subcomplex subunit 1 n=1 Tax=Tilletia horrida TaxID=155126 RepID=A0AAN6G6H2_9BASI|nr:hypothetical protein OC842_007228 [Tilletia horrida]KAK0559040.1 hypothetical protein OC844_004692 [Tilletia horrida]
MPVPWEAVLPMGLVVVLFGVTGSGFSLAKRLTNDGRMNAEAPPEFSVNSAWQTERVKFG